MFDCGCVSIGQFFLFGLTGVVLGFGLFGGFMSLLVKERREELQLLEGKKTLGDRGDDACADDPPPTGFKCRGCPFEEMAHSSRRR